MLKFLNRRNFLKKSIITSAGVSTGLSLEEQALLAKSTRKPSVNVPESSIKGMPMGKIGKYDISRLMCGGNLISFFAHARNLIYVSSLLKHYFTDDKVIETLKICEENGINTAILRCDERVVKLLKRYWNEEGGKMQWIAQTYPKVNDLKSNIQMAIDNGAIGAYMQGGVGDDFYKHQMDINNGTFEADKLGGIDKEYYKNGKADLIGGIVDFIKKNGLIAGVGSHLLEVVKLSEETGVNPDFYVKTLNKVDYVCDNLKEVIEYMKKVDKPWVAFKVLGAGVTEPRRGFKDAFNWGADFINIGMYDFQVKEDALISKRVLTSKLDRERPWCA